MKKISLEGHSAQSHARSHEQVYRVYWKNASWRIRACCDVAAAMIVRDTYKCDGNEFDVELERYKEEV